MLRNAQPILVQLPHPLDEKRTSLGANYQQEVDLNTLFKDVASEYVMTVMEPAQARLAPELRALPARNPRIPVVANVDALPKIEGTPMPQKD